ncbi:GNAT family N-acetyltransferase [Collimonas sp. NPDC087041]|uniref:GNAT family N-acetyltransferase n=1 Tax=Collimonas sp. NPDC087041 TaxID=3363960 RepID=UPI0037FEBE88
MHITVRGNDPQDFPALRDLFLAERRQTYTWAAADAFQLQDLDRQTVGETILVAKDEHREIVGFISIWEKDRFIHHLYVASQQQGKGVGKALLSALPNWPEHKYTLKCLALNQNAIAFYRACGFSQTGSGNGEDGEYIVFQSN